MNNKRCSVDQRINGQRTYQRTTDLSMDNGLINGQRKLCPALLQGSPPATDYAGCEARKRTCSEHETGTEELCEIKWDYHIVGTTA